MDIYNTHINEPSRLIRLHPQVPIFDINDKLVGYWDLVVDLINNYITHSDFTFWYGKKNNEEMIKCLYIVVEPVVNDFIKVMQKVNLYKHVYGKKKVFVVSRKNDYAEIFEKYNIRAVVI